MGLGSDDISGTKRRIEEEFSGNDQDLIDALIAVLKQDAENHKRLTVVNGEHQGMTVMGMAASTGCNTVLWLHPPIKPSQISLDELPLSRRGHSGMACS